MTDENIPVQDEPTPEPTQPEAEAPAEEVEGSEADTNEESATSGDAPERRNKGVGKRINELTREKYEAIRKAEALEARLREVEAAKAEQAALQPTRSKPTLESCNYDPEAFAEAVAEWKIEQTFAAREAKAREFQQRTAAEEKAAKFSAKVQELEAISPGAWQRAITAPINPTKEVLDVIQSSDVGPHIGVWLADNLDEAESIIQLSRVDPLRAAARLGQVEAQIKSGLSKRQTKTTSAPPPAPKVSGSAPVSVDPSKMTMAEYMAWRDKTSKSR